MAQKGMAQADESMRLDRFLWFARLTKTRAQAQALAERGHLRLDGRVVDRAHAAVRPGSVLAFAQAGCVRILRVEALPPRRGPPVEARGCYADLAPPLGKPEAGGHVDDAGRGP